MITKDDPVSIFFDENFTAIESELFLNCINIAMEFNYPNLYEKLFSCVMDWDDVLPLDVIISMIYDELKKGLNFIIRNHLIIVDYEECSIRDLYTLCKALHDLKDREDYSAIITMGESTSESIEERFINILETVSDYDSTQWMTIIEFIHEKTLHLLLEFYRNKEASQPIDEGEVSRQKKIGERVRLFNQVILDLSIASRLSTPPADNPSFTPIGIMAIKEGLLSGLSPETYFNIIEKERIYSNRFNPMETALNYLSILMISDLQNENTFMSYISNKIIEDVQNIQERIAIDSNVLLFFSKLSEYRRNDVKA